MADNPVTQMMDDVLRGFETEARLAQLEEELEREYAQAAGVAYVPGLLHTAASPLVVALLLQERIRNRATLEAFERAIQPDLLERMTQQESGR